MTDISALGIKITSSGVVKTTDELERFVKASKDAGNATSGIKSSSDAASNAFRKTGITVEQAERHMRKASIQLAEMAKQEKIAAQAADKLAASAKNAGAASATMGNGFAKASQNISGQFKFTAQEGLNFSRQMADIGVTAAMGMNPLMIALQQGPQLFDILQTSAIRNGTGIGGALRGVAASAGSLTAALGLAAVAVGAAGVGMWAWLETVNEERKGELDAYAESIGLTAEQIERAGGAAVTASDMMLGLWDTIKEALGLEDIFDGLKKFIIDTFRAIAKDAIKNISEIVAAIRVIDDIVNFVGDNIGAIIGDAFVTSVNAAIDAIEWLINKAIAGFNKLNEYMNPVRKMLGFSEVPKIADVSLGKLENKWAGTIKRGMALTGNFAKYSQETASGMYSFIDRAEENMVNRSKKRLDGAVDETTKKAKDAHKKAAKDAADEWQKELERGYSDFIKGLNKDLGNIDKWMKDWEKMVDAEFKGVIDGINEKDKAAERLRDAEKTWEEQKKRIAEENRRKALDAAYTIADIIGGAFGDVVGQLTNAIIPLVDVTTKFGQQLEAFAKGAALGGAVGGVTGSRTGGAIGGGLGQVVGESIAPMLGKLGKFAGPLGAIAGGILGGVIGGLVKKTPRASATVSIIAGEAMETAIKGSSDKLKKAAGQMANGIIDGLTSLADQLGAQLIGDATVSIGMRKKNYRVDPTGQGITKTSKGAIDFGEDQAAAIAYAMQVAIQQGVLGGLSESMKRLIMADGDLQTQISKALSFKGVFDELAQNDDPAKWAQDEITRWRENMDKIFKEAGATADELAELERLTGIKRAKAAEEAAEKIAQAEREANERHREIRDKNIELLEAQGKIEEAEAMARQARIDDAPEYLRSIQQQIEAANQLREAEEKLAERRAIAAQNAQTEFGLMERLAAAQGNTAEATRLQRENELRLASDSVTRAYLMQIYAAEDLAVIAAKQAGIDKERFDLETRLLTVQENTASLRQRELDALDPANQALLQMIFNLEDMKVATAAAAAAQKEISDEINGLNRQWLELTGQTQVLRDMDLELLKSDEARDLQKRIWDYQDALERQKAAQEAATAAMEEYSRRLEDARNTLVSAYERESGALQQTIDKFRDFSASIKEFRDGLVSGSNPAFGLAQAQARFANTSTMARLGNEASLSSFTGDAQAYLDAARSGGTFEQYQRALASVLSGSSNAMKGADGVANMAQRQLDRMTGIMETLGLIREDDVPFNQALSDYNKALTEEVVPYFAETVSTSIDELAAEIAQGNATSAENGEVTKVTLETLVMAMNRVSRILDRAERDGSSLAVTLDGETIKAIIEGTVPVNVTNTPLPVDQVP